MARKDSKHHMGSEAEVAMEDAANQASSADATVFSDFMQKIQDVSKRLQVELQPFDRDPES